MRFSEKSPSSSFFWPEVFFRYQNAHTQSCSVTSKLESHENQQTKQSTTLQSKMNAILSKYLWESSWLPFTNWIELNLLYWMESCEFWFEFPVDSLVWRTNYGMLVKPDRLATCSFSRCLWNLGNFFQASRFNAAMVVGRWAAVVETLVLKRQRLLEGCQGRGR